MKTLQLDYKQVREKNEYDSQLFLHRIQTGLEVYLRQTVRRANGKCGEKFAEMSVFIPDEDLPKLKKFLKGKP